MRDYVARLCELLDVDLDTVDLDAVLELARDAAHNVERPAAPVTAYVVGLAVGRARGGEEERRRAFDAATGLATGWGEST